jgi:hypothetical protein
VLLVSINLSQLFRIFLSFSESIQVGDTLQIWRDITNIVDWNFSFVVIWLYYLFKFLWLIRGKESVLSLLIEPCMYQVNKERSLRLERERMPISFYLLFLKWFTGLSKTRNIVFFFSEKLSKCEPNNLAAPCAKC